MTLLTRDLLLEDIRKLFLPAEGESKAIGVELEMLPVNRKNGLRVLAQSGTPNGADFVSSVARELGWKEESMSPDPSCWNFPEGRVSFEPGGQIEFSSTAFPNASALIDSVEKWISTFRQRAEHEGITLKTVGIEDEQSIDDIPLQLHRERYEEMTRYFDSTGPFGVLMMRQTASLQINVDRGTRPLERWRLLNALAPYLVAIFANSPRYAGKDTGHKSFRAHVWRMLDSSRTGIVYDSADPVARYLDFALDAPVILARRSTDHPTFRTLLHENVATREMWDVHLSTLFPEIRPREYFEIRSIDAIDPGQICAAVAFVCGLVYSDMSASAAIELTGNPDEELLDRAGRHGLDDPDIRETAAELVRIALDGCRALGPSYIAESFVHRAEDYLSP